MSSGGLNNIPTNASNDTDINDDSNCDRVARESRPENEQSNIIHGSATTNLLPHNVTEVGSPSDVPPAIEPSSTETTTTTSFLMITDKDVSDADRNIPNNHCVQPEHLSNRNK